MNQELEDLFQEWEKEELEYQEYLNSQIQESKQIQETFQKIKEMEIYNICSFANYLNLIAYCIRFIVLYLEEQQIKNKKLKLKIEKPNYSVYELD